MQRSAESSPESGRSVRQKTLGDSGDRERLTHSEFKPFIATRLLSANTRVGNRLSLVRGIGSSHLNRGKFMTLSLSADAVAFVLSAASAQVQRSAF